LKDKGLSIIEETNYVGSNNWPIHDDHTQVLINSISLAKEYLNYIESTLPFFSTKSHTTKVFDNDYEVLIYSVLMDYTQNLYRHKEKGILVPFGGYKVNILTDKEQHKKIIELCQNRNVVGFSNDFLEQFSEEYEYIGQESPEVFENNLRKVRNLVDERIPIIFLNGSEVANVNPNEEGSTERHCQMNKILSDFISKSKNCYLLDVRKYIKETSDTTDNIRHYQREKYYNMSMELIRILKDDIHLELKMVNQNSITKRIKRKILVVLKKVDFALHE